MTPIVAILLVGLGVWAALDGTALAQVMVSRPLVTGTLTGVILGEPLAGAAIGGCLELLFIGDVPVGGTHLPEPGPAAIPAVALALASGGPVGGMAAPGGSSVVWAGPGGGIAAGLALGILLAWLGGRTVILQRVLNERISARAWAAGGSHARLTRAQLLALTTDGLRGAALTGAGLVAAGVLATVPEIRPGLVPAWPLSTLETLAVAVVIGMFGLGRLLATTASGARVFSEPRPPGISGPRVESGPKVRSGPGRLRPTVVGLLLAGGLCGILVAFLLGIGADAPSTASGAGLADAQGTLARVFGGRA